MTEFRKYGFRLDCVWWWIGGGVCMGMVVADGGAFGRSSSKDIERWCGVFSFVKFVAFLFCPSLYL